MLIALTHLLAESSAVGGPKGTVTPLYLPNGSLTVDGVFSDWPLERFTQVARQPLFPEARDAVSNDIFQDVRGDHLLLEYDRVGFFNGTGNCATGPCGFTNDGPQDYGSAVYFAFDDVSLYIMAVVIDDRILNSGRENSRWGAQNFFYDGYALFFDVNNDSLDRTDELRYPFFDNATPNLDDIEISVGLNAAWPPAEVAPNALGIRQHVERSGDISLMGPFVDPRDFGRRTNNLDLKNGPGGVYRDAIESLIDAGGRDVAARSYDDLQAAGVSESIVKQIAQGEADGDRFRGYVIEQQIPFGFIPEFNPSHSMGFDFYWRETDRDWEPFSGNGRLALNWADWTQNTDVRSTTQGDHLFHASNWGQLDFIVPEPQWSVVVNLLVLSIGISVFRVTPAKL